MLIGDGMAADGISVIRNSFFDARKLFKAETACFTDGKMSRERGFFLKRQFFFHALRHQDSCFFAGRIIAFYIHSLLLKPVFF